MQTVHVEKSNARKVAYAKRKTAYRLGDDGSAVQNVIRYVADHPEVQVIAGYMPIRTEIDPVPALSELHALGHRIALPVIQGSQQPLLFREWTPDSAMIEGDFGALIPRGGEQLQPNLVLVPLVAFDRRGARLGYGGGFYDRTLALLRRTQDVQAMGFAFAAQEIPAVPVERTDQLLDGIITEVGVRHFAPVIA